MSKKKKSGQSSGLAAGIIAFGAAFALISVLLKPHSIMGYVLSFGFSAFFGIIIRIMAQGLDTSVNQKTPESLKKVAGETGDPEVDALLEKGREMITQIRTENDLIPDSHLSDQLDRLENQCAEIFRAVYDKPGKASQIRKFMEYYLPTTLKMVRGYRMLDERGISGAEATQAKNRISDALEVVLQGCDKMLNKLYQDDVLDLTTDIDVLEQMLKRDGLTESALEKAAQQARNAAQIDAAANRISRQRAQAAQQQTAPQAAPKARPSMPKWHIDPRIQAKLDAEAAAQAQKSDDQ